MRTAEHTRQLSIAGTEDTRRRADETTARALDAVRGAVIEAAVNARDELVRPRQQAQVALERAQRAQTEAERANARADLARAEAEKVRLEAKAAEAEARARAEQWRAEAQGARTSSQVARADAEQARAQARKALRARDGMRLQLMNELSKVIEIRRAEHAVVCNFLDVLFDFDAVTLSAPAAGEKSKSSRVSCIVTPVRTSWKSKATLTLSAQTITTSNFTRTRGGGTPRPSRKPALLRRSSGS